MGKREKAEYEGSRKIKPKIDRSALKVSTESLTTRKAPSRNLSPESFRERSENKKGDQHVF
ncbi:hypothetical protein [Adlercreutzia sp. ZJ305]|uniref:hypothetical protein n=1 Tax=Adlercreutzia sp. ZJ305 TaxID=2709408 RepID=UPI0013EA5AB7|nr:hypothetical protein [Adlercreutzia sp. ZJ305]